MMKKISVLALIVALALFAAPPAMAGAQQTVRVIERIMTPCEAAAAELEEIRTALWEQKNPFSSEPDNEYYWECLQKHSQEADDED